MVSGIVQVKLKKLKNKKLMGQNNDYYDYIGKRLQFHDNNYLDYVAVKLKWDSLRQKVRTKKLFKLIKNAR